MARYAQAQSQRCAGCLDPEQKEVLLSLASRMSDMRPNIDKLESLVPRLEDLLKAYEKDLLREQIEAEIYGRWSKWIERTRVAFVYLAVIVSFMWATFKFIYPMVLHAI